MAIIIHIYYKGENGNAKRFAEEMISRGIVERIRKEEGNLKYDYFFLMEDKETLFLIDSWKDQVSLDRHHASPMMEEITYLREQYNLHMQVERYISDEAGVSASDKKFIRK
ncbi:MAG: antibiotic biosynthesis monooxygenase [Anaeroplasmataceae bacterium]|nr:antibiotic biosynthesis monooxygenase [Anaeroplasmataceae bacterium]